MHKSATSAALSSSEQALAVKRYLNGLHDRITAAVEGVDTAKFRRDPWARPEGGGGESRVLTGGSVFERAGVSFSHVFGAKMPPSASNQRPEMADAPFEAMGLSLVFHPRNPYAPTTHCNVRFLVATPEGLSPVWWFGGGFDLTPYYGFDDDARSSRARGLVTPDSSRMVLVTAVSSFSRRADCAPSPNT